MSIASESQSNSQYLSSSTSSLTQSKKATSEISKTYKHASQLYLQRRLQEAYEVLRSVIKPLEKANGHSTSDEDIPTQAPIAHATTSQRIKTWSLYCVLLQTIIDIGEDEGKRDFGQKEWREIRRLVQSGDVWEQVARDGYSGRESSVDAEVVYNLYVPRLPSEAMN